MVNIVLVSSVCIPTLLQLVLQILSVLSGLKIKITVPQRAHVGIESLNL